jgi:hypothetical protein
LASCYLNEGEKEAGKGEGIEHKAGYTVTNKADLGEPEDLGEPGEQKEPEEPGEPEEPERQEDKEEDGVMAAVTAPLASTRPVDDAVAKEEPAPGVSAAISPPAEAAAAFGEASPMDADDVDSSDSDDAISQPPSPVRRHTSAAGGGEGGLFDQSARAGAGAGGAGVACGSPGG